MNFTTAIRLAILSHTPIKRVAWGERTAVAAPLMEVNDEDLQADDWVVLRPLDNDSQEARPGTRMRVDWSIDIWATTPEQAAAKALEIMLDPESTATIFKVTFIDDNLQQQSVDVELLDHPDLIGRKFNQQ